MVEEEEEGEAEHLEGIFNFMYLYSSLHSVFLYI